MTGISSLIKKGIQYGRKLRPELLFRTEYIRYREKLPVEEQLILLESMDGEHPTDNIGAILTELCQNEVYKQYTICLSGGKKLKKSRKDYLKEKGMTKVIPLTFGSKKYFKVLATAKFLVTEVSFHYSFIKRPEQIILNTWHGTPLKTLGKQMNSDFAMIGNIQRNFLDADYLLCPNEFTKEVLIRDYMLANLAKTKILFTGYPRNERLLNEENRQTLRRTCDLENKQVIAFMPTWRGTMEGGAEALEERLLTELTGVDQLLSKNQVVYLKLHQKSTERFDVSAYQHIRLFPKNYDTYEFLNAADILVTDYSSVLFDFAITGRKIILFPYDRGEYEKKRGLYMSLDELPFPKVYSAGDLVKELNRKKNYEDSEFLERFCPFDKVGTASALCRHVILGEPDSQIAESSVPDNGKPNVALFFGNFEKNGITTAALNLLENVDDTKHNFLVLYRINDVKNNQEVVKQLPENVAYMGFYRAESMTIPEFLPYAAWKLLRRPAFQKILPVLKRYGNREKQRILGNCRINQAIQYIGYVPEMIAMMAELPCHRTIFVHSDMERESDVCKKIDKQLLRYAYSVYDDVVTVTEGIIPSIKRICETAEITVCENIIAVERIKKLAECALKLDKQTTMSCSEDELRSLLCSEKTKLITIGRFSLEKGHERLIKAFERLHKEYPDTCLILVGGYGALFQKTIEWARKAECAQDIVVIRYMSNPYPLLKQCDAFVMSSYHEALPVVLTEADLLGLPCFCTDSEGPRVFMKEHGGMLVKNSEEGIYEGMLACVLKQVPAHLTIDYEEHNRQAIRQFETILVK